MYKRRNITVFDNLGSLGEMKGKNDKKNGQVENGIVTTTNLTWDRNASQKGLERAAQTVSQAVERAANSNAKDITAAVGKGTDRIVAAIAKINNDAPNGCVHNADAWGMLHGDPLNDITLREAGDTYDIFDGYAAQNIGMPVRNNSVGAMQVFNSFQDVYASGGK